jgi:hypothetical protein
MTSTLERAVAQVKLLPAERQDEFGEMLLAMVEQEDAFVHLTADQRAEVRKRLALLLEFVPDDEMKVFFNSYGR